MTPNFIPAPYVDFRNVLAQVYKHLFSDPTEDAELFDCIAVILEPIENAEESGELDQRVASYNRSRRSRTSRLPINQEALRSVISAGIGHERKKYELLRSEIRNGKLDPVAAMLQPELTTNLIRSTSRETRDRLFKVSHGILSRLFRARRDLCFEAIRSALFRGDLVAYWASPQKGVERFPNSNVWLDNEMSERAFKHGVAKPFLGEQSGSKFEAPIMFRKDNLEQTFPPFQKSGMDNLQANAPDEPQGAGRRPELGHAILRELKDLAPAVYTGVKAQLRRKVAKRLGRDDLDPRTFNKWLAVHNNSVAPDESSF